LPIELVYPMGRINGKRSQMPIDEQLSWWNRFAIQVRKVETQEFIRISSSMGKAGVGQYELPFNRRLIDKILEEDRRNNEWSRASNRTVFELMMPTTIKNHLKDQPNIIWVLDKETAQYPWELFLYNEEEDDNLPYCTRAGMIRQLATNYLSTTTNSVLERTALIIGDPQLAGSDAYQLPDAKKEAEQVEQYLSNANYQSTLLINKQATTIIKSLFNAYKIIHVASHGVVEYGDNKETGILLSDDIVITPHIINQRTSTPELVFINCCHLGDIAPDKEEYTRNKSKLAANIGTQLIETGVKAVVVAAWAVNDAAAKRFAEVFYTDMLNGETFGQAVLRARKSCHNDFPFTNTWGAYQCYGDPFYQLESSSARLISSKAYILEKEVLIDLENLINKTDSSHKKTEDLAAHLNNISQAIEDSTYVSHTPAILEMEARAYANLDLLDKAIEKYEALFRSEKSSYSVQSIEKYCNISMKKLVKERPTSIEKAEELIAKLKFLQNFGTTSERHSLIGSAYKRKAILLGYQKAGSTSAINKAIKEMTDAYKDAITLSYSTRIGDKTPTQKEAFGIKVYWLVNWLIGEKFVLDALSDKKKKAKRLKDTHFLLASTSIVAFLKKKMLQLKKETYDEKEYWDFMKLVNVGQCYLLYCDSKAYKKTTKLIKDEFDLAKDGRGGTPENLESEIAQMQFIMDGLSKPIDPKLFKSLEEVNTHFENALGVDEN